MVKPRSGEVERAQPQARTPSVKQASGCPTCPRWEDWLHLGPGPKRHIPAYLGGNAFTLSKGPQQLPQIWGGQCGPWILAFPGEPVAKSDTPRLPHHVTVTSRALVGAGPKTPAPTGFRGLDGRVRAGLDPASHRRPVLGLLSGPSSLSPLGWCLGLHGRVGASAGSEGLFEVPSSSCGSRYSSLIN